MTRDQIELKLRMPIVNVCLASVGKRENDLRDAKNYLIDEVAKLVREAGLEAAGRAGTAVAQAIGGRGRR